ATPRADLRRRAPTCDAARRPATPRADLRRRAPTRAVTPAALAVRVAAPAADLGKSGSRRGHALPRSVERRRGRAVGIRTTQI
ncbi:hypothetical protein AB0C07_23120, partial [Actinoplanes missouriensis]|uniref:hypothetical protein n=1 Tax=Actinoplanes missouriensis TaxID=1866 RepID=UPI0033F6E18B